MRRDGPAVVASADDIATVAVSTGGLAAGSQTESGYSNVPADPHECGSPAGTVRLERIPDGLNAEELAMFLRSPWRPAYPAAIVTHGAHKARLGGTESAGLPNARYSATLSSVSVAEIERLHKERLLRLRQLQKELTLQHRAFVARTEKPNDVTITSKWRTQRNLVEQAQTRYNQAQEAYLSAVIRKVPTLA
jgi:hypothetical protein